MSPSRNCNGWRTHLHCALRVRLHHVAKRLWKSVRETLARQAGLDPGGGLAITLNTPLQQSSEKIMELAAEKAGIILANELKRWGMRLPIGGQSALTKQMRAVVEQQWPIPDEQRARGGFTKCFLRTLLPWH